MKFKINYLFDELDGVLTDITEIDYKEQRKELQGSSIGQHFRHIIETANCLLEGLGTGIINYDKRKRDIIIEENPIEAQSQILRLRKLSLLEDRALILQTEIDGVELSISTTFYRELLFNIDHIIHHQAIIKHVLLSNGIIFSNSDFGIAPSTIAYTRSCAMFHSV